MAIPRNTDAAAVFSMTFRRVDGVDAVVVVVGRGWPSKRPKACVTGIAAKLQHAAAASQTSKYEGTNIWFFFTVGSLKRELWDGGW